MWLLLISPLLAFGMTFQPLYEFNTLDFVFSSQEERSEALANGTYDPTQNIPTSLRVWNDTLFVAVPRISGFGVPFTLATLDGLLLKPYPNAFANWEGNPAGLRSVQAIEVDSSNRLWVLDSGRYGSGNMTVNGAASLVIIDLQTATILHTFLFPDNIVSFTSSSLQDLVLDQTHMFAFLSDRGEQGAIVMYDYARNFARRFVAPHMVADNSSVITINGHSFPAIQWGMTGIALSPDTETLYFSPVNRNMLFKVPTPHLRTHFTQPMKIPATVVNISQQVAEVGDKTSQSSRLFASGSDTVYFGLLSQNAIGRFQFPGVDPLVDVLANDSTTLQWVDSICIHNGLIYALSNKMHLFFNDSMDWTQVNYRVLTTPTTEKSYIDKEAPATPPSPPTAVGNPVLEDVLIGSAAGVMGLALGALLTSCFMRQHTGWDPQLVEPVNTGWSVSDPQRPMLNPRDSIKSSKGPGLVNNNSGGSGRERGWLFSE